MKAKKVIMFVCFLLLFIFSCGNIVEVVFAQSFKAATIQSPNSASGTDKAATALTLQGGTATGAGAGGDIIFRTSDVGSTGTTRQSLTTKVTLKASGMLGINVITPTAYLDSNSYTIRVRLAKTPASAAAAGNVGDICWDATHIYVCVAASTWVRCTTATW